MLCCPAHGGPVLPRHGGARSCWELAAWFMQPVQQALPLSLVIKSTLQPAQLCSYCTVAADHGGTVLCVVCCQAPKQVMHA
jgi:hypothetical protein